jgi:hypothetical protein
MARIYIIHMCETATYLVSIFPFISITICKAEPRRAVPHNSRDWIADLSATVRRFPVAIGHL